MEAEAVILKTLLLRTHLEQAGVYDEVIEAMNIYLDSYKEELRGKIEGVLNEMNKNARGTKQLFRRHTHIFSVDDVLSLLTDTKEKEE